MTDHLAMNTDDITQCIECKKPISAKYNINGLCKPCLIAMLWTQLTEQEKDNFIEHNNLCRLNDLHGTFDFE